MNVLLMGLRGSGKTTVGRLLAQRMACDFVDLDERVLATFAEPTVTEVWSAHGEAAWRRAETRVLRELLDGGAGTTVIALGGGTPMIEAARTDIEAARNAGTATVFYLRCDTDELGRRVAADAADRPSLTGADPAMETAAVLAARDPVYRDLADHECDVTSTSPQDAAAMLGQRVGA